MGNFVSDFVIMTKPRVWVFLLITGIAGEVFSLSILRSLDIGGFFYVTIYIALGLMGSESVSNYFDLSIDKKMKRTMNIDKFVPSFLSKGRLEGNPPVEVLDVFIHFLFGRPFPSFANEELS